MTALPYALAYLCCILPVGRAFAEAPAVSPTDPSPSTQHSTPNTQNPDLITQHSTPKTQNPTPSFQNLVSKITAEGFYYSGHDKSPYCLENAEGRCLNREFQLFTDIEGGGQFGRRFSVYYKTELNEDGEFRLKKGFGVLRTGIWSWEVGKDTVMLGHGYRGSFVISDNAEGFLLARVRTEEPFRLPWFLSYIGEFKYDLFRGWPDSADILGHRLSWRPVPLLELGANQVVYIPPERHLRPVEYTRIFFSSSENSGDRANNPFDNDQKASLDIALDMPFLNQISPFTTGKVYAEYGGNDSFARWQDEDTAKFNAMRKRQDTKWIWPFDFDFLNIAWLTGAFVTTGDTDFRIEYAQNYASYPLFYDLYENDCPVCRRHGPWYSDLNTNRGQILGHPMGNNAEDLFLEVIMRRNPVVVKICYDQQRRGFSDLQRPTARTLEHRYQYGLSPSYQFKTYTIFADLIYNHYRNVDINSDPLAFDIRPGTRRDDIITGLGVEVVF